MKLIILEYTNLFVLFLLAKNSKSQIQGSMVHLIKNKFT